MNTYRLCRDGLVGIVFGAAAALAWAGIAVAAGSEPVTVHGLTFPGQIAGGTLASSRDFESKYPGLGHSVEYTKPGWKINVFIYDRGQRGIPDDLNGKAVNAEFTRSKSEVQDHVGPGKYQSVKLVRSYVLSQAGQQRFRCTLYQIVPGGTTVNDSFLCLTSWNGKFLKFRMTTAHRDGSNDDVRHFLGPWITLLWSGKDRDAGEASAIGGAGGVGP